MGYANDDQIFHPGKGTYGPGAQSSAQAMVEAYAAAPACHHPAKEMMPTVHVDEVDGDFATAVVANDRARELEVDLFILEVLEGEE